MAMGEVVASQSELAQKVQELKEENGRLEEEILRLREELENKEAAGGLITHCGYLYKHRPWARLLERPWEMRFFSLVGNVLSFWKSDRECRSEPLGHYSLDNCMVIVEGMKRGRFLTFKVLNSKGSLLVRLSALNEAEGRHWIGVLQRSGLAVISEEPDHPFLEQKLEGPVPQQAQSQASSDVTQLDRQNSAPSTSASPLLQREGSGGRAVSFTPSGVGETLRHRRATGGAGAAIPGVSEGTADSATFSISRQASMGKDGVSSPHKPRHGSTEKFTLRPSAPAHRKIKESPLSSTAIFQQSHAGLFNLSVMVLVAVNIRLIIENLLKYGILIRLGFYISPKNIRDWPLLLCGLGLSIFPTIALCIEKLKVHTRVSEQVVLALHSVNTLVGFFAPILVMHYTNSSPAPGFILIFLIVILMMKLISYAHVNADVRALQREGEEEVPGHYIRYPDNITVKNMLYFLAAPTLCYQLGYPHSPYIRKGWVARQIVKLVVFFGLQLFIIEQYINPTVKNSVHPLRGSPMHIVERVLKLSVPTLYVWLCFFYCFFHLWLNILAELLRFGDREFYKDWWNARTIEEYWRLWNMPVHKWLVRHVYFPFVRQGVSKPVAMLIVFFVSAVFHEVVIGVPCHMFRLWAFLGIMGQLPLVILTNYMQRRFESRPMLGNMVFWFVFCIIGQPICVLLYYHDVVNQQQSRKGAVPW